MRGNDWRVIDEPVTPQEQEPVDWMEMLDDGISEPEAEEQGNDVEAAEPPIARISVQEAQEFPDVIESREASTIQPIPESLEAQPESDPDHVVGQSIRSPASDASLHYEQTEDKTGADDHLNPFIHLPTDTPRLLPVPSPGLPIPSPLITSNNPSEYFSSVSTSTTQTPNGGFRTTEARTVVATAEATTDSQAQLDAPQSQVTGTLDSGMRGQRSPSTECLPKALEDASATQVSGPSIVEQPASPVNKPDVDSKGGTKPTPEHEGKTDQLEYAAERAYEERETPVRDVAQYSGEESEADEREESDVGQVYEEENLHEEDEWSEEHESRDEMDEDESDVSRQSFEPNGSRGRSQVETIDLDSDEDEEEEPERNEFPDNAGVVGAGVSPAMHDDVDEDRSHHLDGMEEEKEKAEEGEDKDGAKRARDVDIEEEVESTAEKNDEINGHSEEQYGEHDEEEEEEEEAGDEEEVEDVYDDEMGDYYESENERPADYDDYVDSELESEYGDDEDVYQQPSPPKNAQPEVIVLDSDSDEEPPPSRHAQPTEQPNQFVSEDQEPMLRAPSAAECSSPSETSSSEEEAMSASAKEEYDTSEQPVYGQMVPKKTDEQREEGSQGDQGDENREVAGGEDLEDEAMEGKVTDIGLRDQQMADQQIEPHQDEGDQIDDMHAQDEQVEDEQTGDEQTGDAWNEPINAPMPDSASAADLQHDFNEGVAPDLTAHAHGPALECSAKQPLTAPESTTGTDLAIDPGLLEMQANAEEAAPKRPTEQEMAHVEVRQKEQKDSEQLPDDSGMGERVDNPIWLDGAVSMGGAPVSVKDSNIPPATQHQQPVTLSDSQDVGADHQVLTTNTDETRLTPQYTQEELLDSALQHQVYASASASKDGPSAIQHSSEPDSFVIAPEDQTEASEASPHESGEANHYVGDTHVSGENDGNGSPIASEKYFSPVGPDRDAHSLRTKAAGSTPLATLIDNVDSLTDTISVVWEVSPTIQSASEPKDQILTAQVTDPSMAGTSLRVQITRPLNQTLPRLNEGDALLLRNFKVQDLNGSPMLANGDTSSWTVFRDSEDSIQVDGPPAEYNAEERDYATGIRRWYHEAGAAMAADNQLQASIEVASMEGTPVSSVAVSDDESLGSPIPGSSPSVAKRKRRKRRSHRKITIHELRDGRRYTQVGSPSDKSSIHELRDGTVYANP